ncbi:protein rep [Streptomyces sp. NPDC020379]|uniref:protein rep n=1 Tax=Streptomyces sp. NPDC020379 TaxID=3365071 RepID=UPI0037B42D99
MTSVEHDADTRRGKDTTACAVEPGRLDGEEAAGTMRRAAVDGRQVSRAALGRRQEGRVRAAPGGLADGGGGPLGTTTDFVSPSESETGSDQHKCGSGPMPCCRRRRRFASRRVIWSITTVKRLMACGRVMAQSRDGKVDRVTIKLRDGVAYASGVCACANIWLCPVCSAKIRAGRANEIAAGVARLILEGGTAWMVTFTVRHAKGHALADLIDALSAAFRRLGNGKAAVREKKVTGKIGTINSKEVTYGKNGWHPHLHVIVCFDGEPDTKELAYMMARWQRIWMDWTKKQGYPASKEHGVKWDKVMTAEGAGEYIAKAQDSGKHIGNEMARGDLKKGKLGSLTPFEMIEYLSITGDAAVIPLWQEYEKGTRGKSMIRWSQGLKGRLGVANTTDDDLVEEEVGGHDVAELGEAAWKLVVMHGLESAILEAVETGGFPALVKLLTAHQIWSVKKCTPKTESDEPSVKPDATSDAA